MNVVCIRNRSEIFQEPNANRALIKQYLAKLKFEIKTHSFVQPNKLGMCDRHVCILQV